MSEDRFDYGETLCEAIDTIISKKLEGLSYDITKTCVVIDDTYKKQGRYTIADGALKFEAYSTITTFNINDNVLVNIPYGDYRLQKTILNKIIHDDQSASFNYTSPLNNMLKFTDNIINTVTPMATMTENYFGILANDKDILLKKIYSFNSWNQFSGFDRMGVSVDFQTRLNQYHVVEGNYGIKFLFYGTNNNITELDFGINDMNGNPYYFDTFINQTKLFDISDLEDIKSVDIYLYQSNNFRDENYNMIPSEIEGDPILNIPAEKMNNNILMANLKVYLGYPLDEFNGDSVKISTPGYLAYSKMDLETDLQNGGKRFLNLRWIHQAGENEYVTFTNEDVARENIRVYWFRYALNQTNSEYATIAGGPNWTTSNIQQSYEKDVFKSWFEPDYNKPQERIRAVCGIPDETGTYKYYRSDILTFDNQLATIDTLTYDVATQLTIECLDGSEGNYFIYNPSSKIINEGQGQGYERKFQAKFKGLPLDHPDTGLKNITEITWTIPTDGAGKHTMLTYNKSYWDDGEWRDSTNQDFKYITRKKTEGFLNTTQSYSIKNNWHSSNSSNLIKCEIVSDGMIYETSLELQFGKAGTSGTNITLVLEFDNNENAITYIPDQDSECTIKASMYDMAGSKITQPEGIWSWHWLHGNSYITKPEINDSSTIKLTLSNKSGIIDLESNYHILGVTFTPSIENTFSTPITSYLPIAIKNKNYDYIEGAREIIYNAQGVPEYYTDAYVLFGLDVNNNRQVEIPASTIDWRLKQSNNSYQLALKSLIKNNIDYKALSASPFYIKDYNDKVCISAAINGNIVWSQPILIMQSQYDYATLNNWNGQVEVGDKTIMSAMLGAGKKNEEDNTFSGIIIGDLTSNIENAAEDDGVKTSTGVGLYGLSKGIVSFSLTETGVATFGKLDPTLNQGQVILGGDANTITDANGYYHIDIDNGRNTILYNNGEEKLVIGDDSTHKNYLSLLDKNKKSILDFSKDSYLLQSSNYDGNNGLQINLNNGSITIGNSSKKLTLNSTNSNILNIGNLNIDYDGKLTCDNFVATNGSKSINISSSGDAIVIGDNFKVTSDGTMYYKGTELSSYINNLISNAT